jgi:hypothetical protein
MSKGNTFETDFLALIFNATAITGIAVNHTSSPLTSLQVSLHSSDPGDAGDQTTGELTTGQYNTYARQAVLRTTGTTGWNVTSPGNVGTVSPGQDISFPACVSGTGITATHFAIGTASTGTGKILYSGTLTPAIAISAGVTPRITTASTITED